MYTTKHKRPAHFDYDLVIIGTGSGGGVAAHIAVNAGKSVAVVEKEVIGGECPNYGCVPTKALLQAAETYKTSTQGARFGIKARNVELDYSAVKKWKDTAVWHTGTHDGVKLFEEDGIKVIKGDAHFLTPWTVAVGSRRISAKHFLVATGTRPVELPIPGLKEAGYISYRDAIDLTKPPKSLFVIGGGAIGTEFSELFSTFGVKVHIADITPRLVALENPAVGDLLGELFTRRGIEVHTNAKITRVSQSAKGKTVYFEQDGKQHSATVEEILVSSGKAPNTNLGLENAGVRFNRGGIEVLTTMQTTAKHIYAAGDVVGPYRFTHMASYQSRIAAHNMFHDKKKYHVNYSAVPRCVFVDPEIACAGYTQAQLDAKGISYQIASVPISILGRANTSDIDDGFVQVTADHKGRLLGASIVSPRAGEMIHELTLAIHRGLTAKDVAETIHAFPTWSEAVRYACQKIKVR